MAKAVTHDAAEYHLSLVALCREPRHLRARSVLRQTTGPGPAETLSGAYWCPDGGRRSRVEVTQMGPKMSGRVVSCTGQGGGLRSLGNGSEG